MMNELMGSNTSTTLYQTICYLQNKYLLNGV